VFDEKLWYTIAPVTTIESPILLREVTEKQALRQYIYLPQQLYKSLATWVPPIYADEWKFHDPEKNPALAYSETVKTLAYRDGEPVGRIMGIINRKYNEEHQEKTARFFHLDCIDDGAVSQALIRFVERWAREKGMDKLIGPFGFSDKDPQGVQIEGFEYLAVIAAPNSPPYLQALVEAEGYTKEVDCVSYQAPVPRALPAVYEKVNRRLLRNQKLKVVEFKTKRQMKPYIVPVLRLVNETFTPIFGFVPMSEQEMKRLAAQYMPVLDPDFLKLVTDTKDQIVGFILGIPDMSRGIQKAKGRIFPFGFLYMLAAARKSRQLNLLIGAIKQEFRGIGVNILLGTAIFQAAARRGFEFLDSHLVLESNTLMRAEYEKIGGHVYKRYRVFQKSLV
jgi:GNAT superfamily N-acetyltransferase